MAYNKNFTAEPIALEEILNMVHTTKDLGLPIFQRPLVWDNTKKLELLMSVLNGDPIGSLLWVRVSHKNVAGYDPRKFESADVLNLADDVVLVVDGQQRISAILDIVNAKIRKKKGADRVWAVEIDVRGILDSGDFDLKKHLELKRADTVQSVEKQAQNGVMRAGLLVDDSLRANWLAKFKEVEGWSDTEYKAKVELLPPGITKGIEQFLVPVITLDKQNSLSQVLEYFEKLNTKGAPLVAFDILHSRMSNQSGTKASAYDLRSIVSDALAQSPRLMKLGVDPEKSDDLMLPLQLLASRVMAPNRDLGDEASKQTSDITNGSILALPSSTIVGGSVSPHMSVQFSIDRLEAAAAFLHNQCGVVAPKLLPQKSMLIPIANQLWSEEVDESSVSRFDLRKWFYCLCLQGEFHGRTKSSAVKHVKSLHSWANDGLEPEVIAATTEKYVKEKVDFLEQFKDEPKIMCTPGLAILVSEGAKDWSLSGDKVSDLLENVEIHHICPEGTLADLGIAKGDRWCVANLTPIGATANNMHKKKPPQEVFPGTQFSAAQKADILNGHRVNPARFDKAWTEQRYEALLKDRAAALTQLVIDTLGL